MSDISHFYTQWPRAVVISGFLNFKPKVGGGVKSPCSQQGCCSVHTFVSSCPVVALMAPDVAAWKVHLRDI